MFLLQTKSKILLFNLFRMSKAPFCLDTRPLDADMQLLAEKELRETPAIREAAIIELRRLLQGATDLHYRDDDDFLLIFLRPCHFYPESALKMVRYIWITSFIGIVIAIKAGEL